MDYQEIEKERLKYLAYYNKCLKRGKVLVVISLIGFILTSIISFITVFFKVYYRFEILMIIFLIIFIVGLYLPFKVEKIEKNFSTKYKKPLIELIINKYYDGVKYESDQDLRGVVNCSKIFNDPIEKASAEDIISGEYKGVIFKSFDVIVLRLDNYMKSQYMESSFEDLKDIPNNCYGIIFKGIWFQFVLNRKFDTTIIIKESKYAFAAHDDSLIEVEVESSEFSSKYKVFTSNKQQFFYIFTPVFVENFMKLDEICNGQIMFSLSGSAVNIGINNNADTLELDLFTPIKEALKPLEDQICLAGAIINDFNFASDKFSKVTKK